MLHADNLGISGPFPLRFFPPLSQCRCPMHEMYPLNLLATLLMPHSGTSSFVCGEQAGAWRSLGCQLPKLLLVMRATPTHSWRRSVATIKPNYWLPRLSWATSPQNRGACTTLCLMMSRAGCVFSLLSLGLLGGLSYICMT